MNTNGISSCNTYSNYILCEIVYLTSSLGLFLFKYVGKEESVTTSHTSRNTLAVALIIDGFCIVNILLV